MAGTVHHYYQDSPPSAATIAIIKNLGDTYDLIPRPSVSSSSPQLGAVVSRPNIVQYIPSECQMIPAPAKCFSGTGIAAAAMAQASSPQQVLTQQSVQANNQPVGSTNTTPSSSTQTQSTNAGAQVITSGDGTIMGMDSTTLMLLAAGVALFMFMGGKK